MGRYRKFFNRDMPELYLNAGGVFATLTWIVVAIFSYSHSRYPDYLTVAFYTIVLLGSCLYLPFTYYAVRGKGLFRAEGGDCK